MNEQRERWLVVKVFGPVPPRSVAYGMPTRYVARKLAERIAREDGADPGNWRWILRDPRNLTLTTSVADYLVQQEGADRAMAESD